MLGKLLCVMTLASAALAANLAIVSPAPGTKVKAGSPLTLQLDRPTSSDTEVALLIGLTTCMDDACSDQGGIGPILYQGVFKPQGTDKNGNAYQNVTFSAPNWTVGNVKFNLARVYLDGPANTHKPELQQTSLSLVIYGASG